VLASAVLAVLATLTRERADALRLRLATRGHYVVVGLGSQGARVVARLREKGATAVGIESDRSAARVPGARAHGAIVIYGDGRDTRILDRAQVRRAVHVLIVAGDDSINLEVLAGCREHLEKGGPPRTAVHVAIDDPYLWGLLHRRALGREQPTARVEFISFPDRVAHKLVDAASHELASREVARLLVWGRGPIAVRTAVHGVRRLLLSGRAPELTLGGPNAADLQRALFSTNPWIEELAAASVSESPSARDAQIAFVAGEEGADALAAAARLSEGAEQTQIFVAAPHDASERSLARAGYDLTSIRLVPAEHQALDLDLFDESALEVIARAKHEDYVTQELEHGVSPNENPSLVSWGELPSGLQESNRQFAESVGEKLGELGAALVPLSSSHPSDQLVLRDGQLEDLARSEHERWMRDLTAEGWRSTDGPKDPARKRHPLLVPWDELDEREREKDREEIRALPTLLARIGYELAISPGNTQ